MEYRWSIMEYQGISWNIMEYTMEYQLNINAISWNIMGNTMEYDEISVKYQRTQHLPVRGVSSLNFIGPSRERCW